MVWKLGEWSGRALAVLVACPRVRNYEARRQYYICFVYLYYVHVHVHDAWAIQFSILNWSPRSSELNPIGHLWDALEQGVKDHHTVPTNLTKLRTALANIWQVIPVERFQKLFESMPRRVAAIIKAIGGPTRY
ncbi:transposable element Tcb2 transposase [Trichonephila clavipes]|nr:transposable element Tcb2 transposase [Trichonephila clavipes]